jgi:hypothetical protein
MVRYKRKFYESIPKAPAYWINPSGHILPIFDDEKHIDQIIAKPEAFGFDIDEIKMLYDAEGEIIGSEGKAREKIIKELLRKGWIRIRYFSRQDYFTLNVNRLNTKEKNYIYEWAKSMEENNLTHSQVKIDLPNKVLVYSIKQLIQDVLFNENCEFHLIVVKDVFDLPSIL